MNAILQTEPNMAFVVLRLGLAITFFAHGSQHLFGWFGGKGPKAQISNWRDKYGIPAWIGVLGLVTEVVSVPAMVLGFFVRPLALGLAIFTAVALFKGHWEFGFYVTSRGKGTGIEYCLALLLMSLALLIGGGGALSLDLALSR